MDSINHRVDEHITPHGHVRINELNLQGTLAFIQISTQCSQGSNTFFHSLFYASNT